jgi:ubiquinol-cytochrome c reductase iron-sulfur subunit
VPDFSFYRRESTKNATSKNRDTAEGRKAFSYIMSGTAGVCGTYIAGSVVNLFIGSMAPAANVLAVSKIEVDLDEIPEGRNLIFKYRGKPLFVRHR